MTKYLIILVTTLMTVTFFFLIKNLKYELVSR